ncbi:hypothetical protein HYFRA_00002799, partial [Hymenoscyphus fraxineus]
EKAVDMEAIPMEKQVVESTRHEAGPEVLGSHVHSSMNRDEQEMAFFGKTQQLKRNFGFLSIAGFVCSLLSTWEGLFGVFLYGLQNGGCRFLGDNIIGNLSSTLDQSPSSLYVNLLKWVSILAPDSFGKFLSYLTGWITLIGWQSGLASVAFLGASILQGLVVLNHDEYMPTRWQGTLIFYAIIAFIVFVNTYLARWLPKIEGLVLCIHILGFFAVLIPLVYLAPHSSSEDVFKTFRNGGGWSSDGISFFVGLVTSIFSFLGADSACHMGKETTFLQKVFSPDNHLAEEIHNASTVVPWAMVFSVALNGAMGFGMLIALLFCLGDIDSALESPTGFPFIEIFRQATNSKAGATIMTCIIMVIVLAAAIGIMATSSRLLWSFARDGGVPFSRYINRVHLKTALPLYSILVSTLISLLLVLINIGSTTAFNAFISVNCSAFYSSYLIPISLLLFKRLRNDPVKDKIRWGPWYLGKKIGPLVNIGAIIYTIIALFFSFWPATEEVTLANMNWSVLIFGATVLFSVGFYFVGGKEGFKWPVVDVLKRTR